MGSHTPWPVSLKKWAVPLPAKQHPGSRAPAAGGAGRSPLEHRREHGPSNAVRQTLSPAQRWGTCPCVSRLEGGILLPQPLETHTGTEGTRKYRTQLLPSKNLLHNWDVILVGAETTPSSCWAKRWILPYGGCLVKCFCQNLWSSPRTISTQL